MGGHDDGTDRGVSGVLVRRLLGVAFVALLVLALSMSVLTYRKAFTPVAWVTLKTDHTGLQLNPGADVKLRGVPVGEVRGISADGRSATLRLALNPAMLDQIPANVTARLLPKTLFGEKYVALIVPAYPSSGSLRAGSVVTQDRSATALELERVLDDTLPLLRAIQPDKLAATLGALSTALDGRGDTLGADLVSLDSYLKQLNADLPALTADIHKLATVIATYDGALPDLLAILRNASVTMNTVAQQRDQLHAFLRDTAGFATNADDFLSRYGDRLIQLGQVTAPVLQLLAAYAPEYPCLLAGLVALQPRAEQVFASGQMHITLEVTRDNGAYQPGLDAPVYGAHNGPNCRGLPHPGVPAPSVPTANGYDYGAARSPATLPVWYTPTAVQMGLAGTPQEQRLLKPLIGAATGTSPDQVSDFATLMWGPLLRGTVVNAS
jgi:phospholipid/cholesterol/gamma-HCH transport system substrate-binding protein